MTPEDCEKFKATPNINPLTRRKIKPDGPVAKKLLKECDGKPPKLSARPINKANCMKWKLDRTKNPVTGRKLNTTAKKGIYQQLLSICSSPVGPPPTSPTLGVNREKLIDVLKKVLGPILNKGDSTTSRIKFHDIMTKYLEDMQPCLKEHEGKLYLFTKSKEPIVYFDKRIGSESAYGVAYLNMGKGLAKLLKFSCKLMSSKIKGHKQEIDILAEMSQMVIKGKSPNMPITYKSLKCAKQCHLDICPELTQYNGYYVVINELANMDIQTWFLKSYDIETYSSVIMQLIFSIYSFHLMGYSHNDAHLGNFLIHEIQPGGYWRYQIKGVDVYVENKGYLLVMWDPGMATKLESYTIDYSRALSLITNMHTYKSYMKKGMKVLPTPFIDRVMVPISNILQFSYKPEVDAMLDVLKYIKTDIIKTKCVQVDGKPPGYLLNIKPYTLAP